MDCIFQIYVNFNSLSALSISDPSWFLLDITIIGLYPSASRHSDVLHTKSEGQVTTQISFWLSLLSHDELLDKSLLSCSGWNQCSLKSLGYTGQEERDYELKKRISTSVQWPDLYQCHCWNSETLFPSLQGSLWTISTLLQYNLFPLFPHRTPLTYNKLLSLLTFVTVPTP